MVYTQSTYRNGSFVGGEWRCNCGNPPVWRTVHKSGPTQGARFLRCLPSDEIPQCNFFLWEVHLKDAEIAMTGGGTPPSSPPTHQATPAINSVVTIASMTPAKPSATPAPYHSPEFGLSTLSIQAPVPDLVETTTTETRASTHQSSSSQSTTQTDRNSNTQSSTLFMTQSSTQATSTFNTQQDTRSGSLFGSRSASKPTSAFRSQPAVGTTKLFGSQPDTTTTSLFGSSSTEKTSTLFGSFSNAQTNKASSSRSIFDSQTTSKSTSLFSSLSSTQVGGTTFGSQMKDKTGTLSSSQSVQTRIQTTKDGSEALDQIMQRLGADGVTLKSATEEYLDLIIQDLVATYEAKMKVRDDKINRLMTRLESQGQ